MGTESGREGGRTRVRVSLRETLREIEMVAVYRSLPNKKRLPNNSLSNHSVSRKVCPRQRVCPRQKVPTGGCSAEKRRRERAGARDGE